MRGGACFAGLGGGGAAGSGGANVTVNYCTFATDSDGIHINNQNKLTVSNSIIRKTITTANGASASDVTTKNNLTITTKLTSERVKDATGKVTHTVFRKHAELSAAIDGGDTSVTVDQLGNSRGNKPDLGAVEIEAQSGGDTPLTVATPTFNPAAGTYTGAQSVTISCKTEGATIYYKTSYSSDFKKYTGPFLVSDLSLFEAYAVKGDNVSAIARAVYRFPNADSGSILTPSELYPEHQTETNISLEVEPGETAASFVNFHLILKDPNAPYAPHRMQAQGESRLRVSAHVQEDSWPRLDNGHR